MAKSLSMIRKTSHPKLARSGASLLTPRKLYAAHYDWFSQQREQLSQFLALTKGLPRAVFSLPLPVGYTPVAAGNLYGHAKSGVHISRAELLNLMRDEINEYEASRLKSIRKFLASSQLANITRQRWEERLSGKRRMQLTLQVERLCKVYWCMARGIVEARLIILETGEELSTLSGYRLHLLNGVLGRLLLASSAS
jgi:hypothetical protein